MSDACISSELWAGGEVKLGQTTLVPSMRINNETYNEIHSYIYDYLPEVEIRFFECLVTCPIALLMLSDHFYNLSGRACHSRPILYLFSPVYSLTQ